MKSKKGEGFDYTPGNRRLRVAAVAGWVAAVACAGIDPLDDWRWCNPSPTRSDLTDVAYGGGRFVGVGDGTVVVSPDGENWNAVHNRSVAAQYFGNIAYGNGVFVAGGEEGVMLTSSNGVEWARHTGLCEARMSDLLFSGGVFVAVGDTRATVMISSNGVEWARTFLEPDDSYYWHLDIVASGGGRLVATSGSQYGGGRTYASTDGGRTWTRGACDRVIAAVAYGNGKFVAISRVYNDIYPYTVNHVYRMTSTDGLNWETPVELDDAGSGFNSLVFLDGNFMAQGRSGSLMVSANGENWSRQETGVLETLHAMTYADGTYILVGGQGTLLSSADRRTWVQRRQGTRNALHGVAYGSGRFVAVGDGGTLLQSADGVAWGEVAMPHDSPLRGVVFADSRFAVVGDTWLYEWFDEDGQTNCWEERTSLYTSSDGVSWERQRPRTQVAVQLNGIAYGNGLFVAVGDTGDVLTSTDGVDWQYAPGEQTSLGGVSCLAYGAGSFVAAGSDLSVSADGTNWTVTLPETGFWIRGVAYGNGRFVATGYRDEAYGNDTAAVFTSTNGVAWSVFETEEMGSLAGVVFAQGFFVAVSETGRGVYTSPDGQDWIPRDLVINRYGETDLTCVAFGQNTFVAAGRDGTVIQSGIVPDEATVTTGSDPAGAGNQAGGGRFAAGTQVTVTAIRNSAFRFLNWTEDGNVVSEAEDYTFMASCDRTLVANYLPCYEPGEQLFVVGYGLNTLQYAADGTLAMIGWGGADIKDLVYRFRTPGGAWQNEVIVSYNEREFGVDYDDPLRDPACLQFDASNRPHVFIGGDDSVLHMVRTGDGRWTCEEEIAHPAVPGYSPYGGLPLRMTVEKGPGNSFHILFGASLYGNDQTGEWQWEETGLSDREDVDKVRYDFTYYSSNTDPGVFRVPRATGLAIDGSGKAHVVYCSRYVYQNIPDTEIGAYVQDELCYASNVSGEWRSQALRTFAPGYGSYGYGASIAVSPAGTVAVAGFGIPRVTTGSTASPAFLFYDTLQGDGSWVRETVADRSDGYVARDGEKGTGWTPYLRFDPQGTPHIVFCDHASEHLYYAGCISFGGNLRHAKKAQTGWTVDTVYRQTDPLRNQLFVPVMAVSTSAVAYLGVVQHADRSAGPTYDFLLVSGYAAGAGTRAKIDYSMMFLECGPGVIVTVSLDGQGGDVAVPQHNLRVGGTYGVLPVPTREGYHFAGWWTGPDGTGVRITEGSVVTGLQTLYAKWIDGHFDDPSDGAELTTIGAFDGYFYGEGDFDGAPATAVRGTLNVKVAKTEGALTAKAVLQKGSLSFSAKAWTGTEADGTRRATLPGKGGETLELYVRQDRVWGTLSGGSVGGRLELDGARNRFAGRGDAAAQALLNRYLGYYTVALPVHDALSLGGADAAPRGVGYLAVTVGKGGSAKIAGVLADGTKVAQSSRLVLFGGDAACVPFFAPLYAKQGWAGGLLWVAPDRGAVATDRDLGWRVRWEKPGKGPDGFRALLDACGGYYSGAPSLAAHYLFGAEAGGALFRHAGGAEEPVVIPDGVGVTAAGMRMTMEKGAKPTKVAEGGDVRYEYADVNPASATLTFTARTGLLKGKFSLYYDYVDASDRLAHKAVNVPYAGVLTPVRDAAFAALPAGLGHCLVPENDPALKAYKIKRSFPVWLEAE